jgi:ABC-2 type transport system ATP-binding protein
MDSVSEKYGVAQAATGSARSEPVVSVRGLVKRYARHEAVAGIDLEARRGEIFAFLGPNGAGKTKTVEILEGFQQRTAGQVLVLGHDPATAGSAWRERVGVVLQESQPEPGLSVRECLAMYAGLHRAPRDIDQTIALVGLTEKADALGARLSGGQRRRLDFALALIGDPELIFLDEPTTGFDPSARRAAWEVVAGLRQPPFDAGAPHKASDQVKQAAGTMLAAAASRDGPPGPRTAEERQSAVYRATQPSPSAARAPRNAQPDPRRNIMSDARTSPPQQARYTVPAVRDLCRVPKVYESGPTEMHAPRQAAAPYARAIISSSLRISSAKAKAELDRIRQAPTYWNGPRLTATHYQQP